LTRFRITVAYDGTNYAGWQVQPGLPTVQQALEEAIKATCGHEVKLHGSGRTDRGVHARGQVAHFDAETRMGAKSMLLALNSRIPPDIRVVAADTVPDDFHARRSAVAKEYRYVVWNGPVMPPEERLYAYLVHRPLDMALVREGAARFVGEHDFVAFMANPQRELDSTVREIYEFEVSKAGRRIVFRVKGSGFLYKQVRSMVGMLIRVGTGAERAETITRLLDTAAPRTAHVPSAPPQGLTLWKVWY
jgi:tRNA pseudouridine38-40 synthase